jgi:hypothetical protein
MTSPLRIILYVGYTWYWVVSPIFGFRTPITLNRGVIPPSLPLSTNHWRAKAATVGAWAGVVRRPGAEVQNGVELKKRD